MNIFDGLEKLINEHGSATILKERLQLAKERHEALERKCAGLEKENEELRNKIAAIPSESSRIELAPDETAVLCFFAQNNGKWFSNPEVMRQTGLSSLRADFAVERLDELRFLRSPGITFSDHDLKHTIDQAGREYVLKNNLMS